MKRYLSFVAIVVVGVATLALFALLGKMSDSARTNFYRVKKELDAYRQRIWHLEKLDPKQLEWQLASMENRFLTYEKLSVVIGELTELAKTCEVSITSISPSEKIESNDSEDPVLSLLSRTPIEIRLVGKYEQAARFLTQLGSMSSGVMKVDRFRLDKEKEGSDLVTLSLAASLYLRKSTDQKILEADVAEVPLERMAGRSRFQSISRNPFTKVPVRVEKTSPVVLQGILYDAQQPLALINGDARRIGEVVNGMKIIEINPDNVVLEKDGQTTKMQLRWD